MKLKREKEPTLEPENTEEPGWLDLDDDPAERSSTELPDDETEEAKTEEAPAEITPQPVPRKDSKTMMILGCFACAAALAIAALVILNLPSKQVTLELPQQQVESDGDTMPPADDPHLKTYDSAAAEITKALITGQHTVSATNGDKLMMIFDEGGAYTGPDQNNPVAYGKWELSVDNDSTIHVTYQDGHTADFVIGQDKGGNITLTASWDTYTFVETKSSTTRD